MPIIDADAHVIETDRTWEFMDEADEAFRPRTVVNADPSAPSRFREFWGIDGRLFGRRVFDVERTGTSEETREIQSIEARLRHMDDLGVDVHVLYPTLFLSPVTTRPEVEAALYKSYNRWMADIWSKSDGRLLWAVLAPTMTMDLALDELRWAKERGGCAVFLRGAEGGKVLSSPTFHPLYAEASRLNMPICVHAGNGSFQVNDLYAADSAIFSRAKLTALGAFHDIVMSHLPDQFPDLRFGMIETSASWVPYVWHDLAARLPRMFDEQLDRDFLKKSRIYVACQTDDDLPYVLQYAGEDNLVIGSDYGHADTSSELEALRHLKKAGKLPASVIDKILDKNARALYGL
jgi:predicted TIM-barrel fold metal-dependent hydrolase